jgi:TctA family transporter
VTGYNTENLWLQRTNQVWKILAFYFLLFLSVLSIVIWMFVRTVNFHLLLMGIFLGIISLFWIIQSIKCPSCGAKPVWHIMRTANFGEWFIKIIKMRRCPSCSE